MQSRQAEARLVMAAAERSLLEALPDRDGLKTGSATGTIGNIGWRMSVTPIKPAEGATESGWLPYRISVQLASQDGMTGGFETIRLGRKEP